MGIMKSRDIGAQSVSQRSTFIQEKGLPSPFQKKQRSETNWFQNW